MSRRILTLLLAWMSMTAHPVWSQESWSVELLKQNSWGHNSGIEIDNTGLIKIVRTQDDSSYCRRQPIDLILYDLIELLQNLPIEFRDYNHVAYRNICMDNTHTIISIFKHPELRVKIDYVNPDCSNGVVIPEQVKALEAYLTDVQSRFDDCEVQPRPDQ